MMMTAREEAGPGHGNILRADGTVGLAALHLVHAHRTRVDGTPAANTLHLVHAHWVLRVDGTPTANFLEAHWMVVCMIANLGQLETHSTRVIDGLVSLTVLEQSGTCSQVRRSPDILTVHVVMTARERTLRPADRPCTHSLSLTVLDQSGSGW